MRRQEYFYDSTGNLLLVLEIVYYVVVLCYYVYQWIKNRRVRIRAYRQERRERRRILFDARTFAVAICAALGLGSAARAEVFWESVDAVHASAVPKEQPATRPAATYREGAKSAKQPAASAISAPLRSASPAGSCPTCVPQSSYRASPSFGGRVRFWRRW